MSEGSVLIQLHIKFIIKRNPLCLLKEDKSNGMTLYLAVMQL